MTKQLSNKGDFQFRQGKMLFNRLGPIKAVKQRKNDHYGERDEETGKKKMEKNYKAPEKRGLWAFPYPIFDHFFVTNYWDSGNPYAKIELSDNVKRQVIKRLKGLESRYKQILLKDSKWEAEEIKWQINELQEALDTNLIGRWLVHNNKLQCKPLKPQTFWWGGIIYARFAPRGMECHINNGLWYRYENAITYLKDLRRHLFEYMDGETLGVSKKEVYYKCMVKGIGQGDFGLCRDHLEVFIPYRG